MEVKKIVEGMTAPQVAEVIDENFNGLNTGKADKEEVNTKFSQLDEKLVKIDAETIYTVKGYLNNAGSLIVADGYFSTDFLLVDKMCNIEIVGIEVPSGAASLCFYDINKKRISEGIVMGGSNIECKKEDIPSEAVFFRSSTSAAGITKKSYLSYTRVETILTQYDLVDIQKNKQMNKLFIKNDLFSVKGAYINMAHAEQAISSYNSTDYLTIDKNADIIINKIGGQSGSYAVNFYDKNKQPITDFDYSSYLMTGNVVTHYIPKEDIPQNAVYIRSCVMLEYYSEDTYIINANISSLFMIMKEIEDTKNEVEKIKENVSVAEGISSKEKIYDVSVFKHKGYISVSGIVAGNYSDLSYTDFIEVSGGDEIQAVLGVNGQVGAVSLYTDNSGSAESVSRVINGGDFYNVAPVEFKTTVTGREKYIRVCSSVSKFESFVIKQNGVLDGMINLSDLFDYKKVMAMPKQVVRSLIESASNGKCTVLYDENGMPSIMRKIPVVSIGALSKELGDMNTPHPAFVVDGETKNSIYVSCFQTSIVDGVPVSWFGLAPHNDGNSYRKIKDKIKAKGNGWHLETIYERSLLSLLSVKYHNTPKPRGNTLYGRSHEEGFEYECVERVDGKLPGEETFAAKWINGAQPVSWSHDNTNWGVFDLVGGYWEWCDLLKVVDGQIIIAEDNNYNSSDIEWVATGVYIDVKEDGNIYFDTSRSRVEGSIIQKPWSSIVISDNYSKLSESLRKKLALLLVCPKVNATDEKPLFDFSGNLWIKTDSTYYPIIGGAEEYGNGCGFGQIAISYPETEAHGNMGSRMCFFHK